MSLETFATIHRLTKREKVVLEHLLSPDSLSDIARTLNRSRDGLKYHARNIFDKLGHDNRIGVVTMFYQAELDIKEMQCQELLSKIERIKIEAPI